MRYLALCCDYDGTLAHHGNLDAPTIAALERLKQSGRRLVMVTGRELDELQTVCTRLDLFDRVVAENGALLYQPDTGEEKRLGERPPDAFVAALKAKGVERISVGRVIVATWEPHQNTVLDTIHEMGLELQVIFNKGAVMILPAGINKASGLRVALNELNLSEHNAVGVGDAENDHAFLSICECGVAVSNALPSLKERADIVTRADHGAGVAELIEEMVTADLAQREPKLVRHHIVLGTNSEGASVRIAPYGLSALLTGPPSASKFAKTIIDRTAANGYSFCVIDTQGEYQTTQDAVALGSAEHAPTLDECTQLLLKPETNAVINVNGVPLAERPRFFLDLFKKIQEVRARTGRPHLLIVDQADRVVPADSKIAAAVERLEGVLLVSAKPSLIATPIVRALDSLIASGTDAQGAINEFSKAKNLAAVTAPSNDPQHALFWANGAAPTALKLGE